MQGKATVIITATIQSYMNRFLAILFLFFGVFLNAQKPLLNPRYHASLWEVNLSYKVATPMGDLALRYGFINGAGLDLYYKSKKNYLIGVNSNLFFGRNVHGVDYVNIFKDKNGYVFSDDGTPVFVSASMRGSEILGTFGKLFPVFTKTPQLALTAQIGVGFLQHKYLFSAPGAMQFNKVYLRGYDRLSNGFALSQQLGLSNLGLKRLINFNIGIEFTEAFTQNRRYYDYGTGGVDTKKYLDIIAALKCSWVLPIKANDKSEPVYFK